MQEKGTSRAWTQEEDDLLVQVMNRNGGFENWKEVATLIPGRTNKACRKVCLSAVLFVGPYSHFPASDGSILFLRILGNLPGRPRKTRCWWLYTIGTRINGQRLLDLSLAGQTMHALSDSEKHWTRD